MGANNDVNTEIGPLITEESAIRLENLLSANRDTATVLRGETRSEATFFPTIVCCTLASPVLLIEKYGPLFALAQVPDAHAAESAANNIEYALGATVFSSEEQCSLALNAPHIAHNSCLLRWEDEDAHRPFGGIMKSGFVSLGANRKAGPILYSGETSIGRE